MNKQRHKNVKLFVKVTVSDKAKTERDLCKPLFYSAFQYNPMLIFTAISRALLSLIGM